VASADYNANNQQLTFGGETLTYDFNGNLTDDGTNTYTWDARNRLISIGGPVAASFIYDAAGRRARKTIDGVGTDFVHDGLNPVQERTGSTTTNLLTGLGVDEYFRREGSTDAALFLTDAVGSTVALVDNSGGIPTTYTYEPFGRSDITGSPTSNPYDFTGRERDIVSVTFYRARYYRPASARFTSEDPIGFAGGDINLYAYVWNNPTLLNDPLGLDAAKDDCSYAGTGCKQGQSTLGGRKHVEPPGETQLPEITLAEPIPNIELGIGGRGLSWLLDWRRLGPSEGYKKTGQGRVGGVVHRPTGFTARIDYHPLQGSGSPPEWHVHFGTGEHNPIRIPRLPGW